MSEIGISIIASSFVLYRKLLVRRGVFRSILLFFFCGKIRFCIEFFRVPKIKNSHGSQMFVANVTNYLTNDNGHLPGAGTDLDPKKYVNPEGTDSAGKTYKITVKNFNASDAAVATMNQGDQPNIYLIIKGKCDDANQGKAVTSSGNRDFAVIGQLETGVFCQDNV